jgi:hypothetical protein
MGISSCHYFTIIFFVAELDEGRLLFIFVKPEDELTTLHNVLETDR